MYNQIIKRSDNSYVIQKNGLPYHVPNTEEWAEEWANVDTYAKAHPEVVTEEQPPAPPTLEEMKLSKLSEINAAYDSATSSLVATYPQTELLTFDKQESEAKAWKADNSVETPFLNGLAAARGIDKAELVGRVIFKADAFQMAVATLTGLRQKYEDQLEAATTTEEIEAIVPEYKLPEA